MNRAKNTSIGKPVEYGEVEYWDQRYLKEQDSHFEWLQDYEALKQQIEEILHHNKQAKILHVGCGNSELQFGLYEAGYHNITNIDISGVVIEQMRKEQEKKGFDKMKFEVMDVTQMQYPDQCFDLVLDKSTIDTLMCTQSPLINVAKMAEESHRVLKPGCAYFGISYAPADKRLQHITRENVRWEVQSRQISKLNKEEQLLTHYIYICRKVPMKELSKQQRQIFYQSLRQIEQKQYL